MNTNRRVLASKRLGGLIAVALFGLGSVAAAAGQKDLPAQGVSALELETISGDVVLLGGTATQISVRWENGAGEPPLIAVVDGTLKVDATQKKQDGNDGWDLTVTMPAQVKTRVKAVSGDIHARGLAARAQLVTVSGDLKIEACTGDLDLKTVSGDLVAEGARGDLTAKTVSGEVTVRDAQGALVEIKTVSGEITLSGSALRKVRIASTSGDVSIAGALGGEGGLSAKSFSGDLTVRLPADASFDLQASTRSGEVTVEHALSGDKGEHAASGRIGQGGAAVQLSSFSGDVHLRASR